MASPAVLLVVGLALLTGGRPSAQVPPAADPVHWIHPVDAEVVDGFRPPSGPYGPGNRGLEYGTEAGQPVRAVASGTVRFAGQVGGELFVVVDHGGDLRSTYAYLIAIEVVVDQRVGPADPIGAADVGFHLTARRSGAYIDPLTLLEPVRYRVRLIPLPASSGRPGNGTSRPDPGRGPAVNGDYPIGVLT